MKLMSKRNGFTLVEILVVITIIATLASISFATFNNAQIKTRDGIRKNDLNSLKIALEIYAQKNNLSYVGGTGVSCSTDTGNFYTTIAPYMANSKVPKDPSPPNNQYCYISLNSGSSFRLFAKLENCSNSNIPNINCSSSPDWNYSVTSEDLIAQAAPSPAPATPHRRRKGPGTCLRLSGRRRHAAHASPSPNF